MVCACHLQGSPLEPEVPCKPGSVQARSLRYHASQVLCAPCPTQGPGLQGHAWFYSQEPPCVGPTL